MATGLEEVARVAALPAMSSGAVVATYSGDGAGVVSGESEFRPGIQPASSGDAACSSF